jgi:hypothetical protein
MPKQDYTGIKEATGFVVLPKGQYHCIVEEIEIDKTSNGDEMWNMTFVVADGEFEGRKIFDKWVWSEKGKSRMKYILHRFGINTDGVVNVVPEDIDSKHIILDTDIEEYETQGEGESTQKKQRTRVGFTGYIECEQPKSAKNTKTKSKTDKRKPEDDLPF